MLRSDMTPAEVREQLEASSEDLPEAVPVDRELPEGTATATAHAAGDEPYADTADEAASGLPADPPTTAPEG